MGWRHDVRWCVVCVVPGVVGIGVGGVWCGQVVLYGEGGCNVGRWCGVLWVCVG